MLSAVMSMPAAKAYEAFEVNNLFDEPRATVPSIVDVLMAALEEIDNGMMVVDPITHRLLHANRLAMLECRGSGTLLLEQGQVMARAVGCRQPLERAIGLVTTDRRSFVSLERERGFCTIAVVPLTELCGTRFALLQFGKHTVCEPLSVGFYARLHALTPSEDSVLRALCRGLRPAQIAAETGVAISTVRTQVSSIRMKTRTSSIHDLVRTMSTLPPINPVLRMVSSVN